MGQSLSEYLSMKVHPLIQYIDWSRIIVVGEHQRDPSVVRITSNEKTDKPFNWQRPTVSVVDTKTLQLHVFPGTDYVAHYAAILATYLSLEKGQQDVVQYTLPSQDECLKPLLNSNLAEMGAVDIVVVGYVDHLERWAEVPWEGNSSSNLFSWKMITSRRGYRIALLGCRICFWGDIGGNVVRALQRLNGAKCVLYVGKLGSLRADHVPNNRLATGCQSLVRNELVTWVNPLEPHVERSPTVAFGVHCSLGSVLDETKEWLAAAERRYDFVDPEIGHMAKASSEGRTDFGYLHIISDNLARKYIHDLSNERLTNVLQDRKRLFSEIQDILGRFFDHWSPS
ncbi:hypothetical protein JMJ35_008111 [Cladonia borealis]|uniref:Uncharacterized protein n=1 Tax=Cladonia borealis TaxID=184061 RepID=A0AA39QUY8_9LECA|nr:hypothetical protein JMJ35_008111 [Cladonia borealis]